MSEKQIVLNHNQLRSLPTVLLNIPQDASKVVLQMFDAQNNLIWIMHPKIHLSLDQWGTIRILMERERDE